MMHTRNFSKDLQAKIDFLKEKSTPTTLGNISFDSNLIMAPMAGITTLPFRLLMKDLGAGATVTELISTHGINYNNQKTLDMLKLDSRETNVGIQLFGEDADSFAKAAKLVQERNPKFIDINMGCPVRKVVAKGGGSAMMRNPKSLGTFFNKVKSSISIPLTIKIRTGWNDTELNAHEIVRIAKEEGIEFVTIHGRTKEQLYSGAANWEYIEKIAKESNIPIIGNGDLHEVQHIIKRKNNTNCKALMIARGALRNPFIFLESLESIKKDHSLFTANDYFEVIERLNDYNIQTFENRRVQIVQIRKIIVWFAAGFPRAAKFRGEIFKTKNLDETMKQAQNYFHSLKGLYKKINYTHSFMNGGHG